MKKIKVCLKMVVTAVICFMISLIPSKRVRAKQNGESVRGQAAREKKKWNRITEKIILFPGSVRKEETVSTFYKKGSFLKKVRFRMLGPGDLVSDYPDESDNRNVASCYENSG